MPDQHKRRSVGNGWRRRSIAERRWQTLAQVADLILWTVDPAGKTSDQRGWSEYTGHSAASMNKATWFTYVHPDDLLNVQEHWSQAKTTQSEYLVECRVRRADGVYRTFMIQGVPVRNDDGTLREWAGVAIDITELRQAEAERDAALLREHYLREGQLMAVLDAAVDGIVIYHADGTIMHHNRAARKMMDFDRDATFDQQPLAERARMITMRDSQGNSIPSEELPAARMLRGEHITAEKAIDVQVRTFHGREIILNVTGAPVCDVDGSITCAVLVFRDVTTQRRAAREQEQMMHIVSHELNTPIASLKSRAQYMRRHVQRAIPLTAEDFTLLEADINRLAHLVEDLVDAGRIDTRHLELRRQACDLADLCVQMVANQHTVTQRAIDIDIAPGAYVTLADARRIEQVLANLIGNALKYAPPPAPVRVMLAREGEQLRVSVQDTGPGIAPAEQARVFERFFRVTNLPVHTISPIGLGLGLYLCKHIVELHGGTIGVQSAPGQGATFWFTLPAQES
jgi:PAS domain S-box-containing protein